VAPNVDKKSDPMLVQRYDELYDNSPDFRSSLHNIVTSNRALLLILDPGTGTAEYDADRNSVQVWRQRRDGMLKTEEEIRDDMLFELHNAKKFMTFEEISGSRGYNAGMLVGDSKKSAGHALAVEWVEWMNVAQCTVLANIVNAQSSKGPLLRNPPEFQGAFVSDPNTWLKFSNYLKMQVSLGHTERYDPAAKPGATWLGTKILQAVAALRKQDLEITLNEFAPNQGMPRLNSRSNPFTWEQVKTVSLY
jgi:hypothetical protein